MDDEPKVFEWTLYFQIRNEERVHQGYREYKMQEVK
jgi:hypothetical protein